MKDRGRELRRIRDAFGFSQADMALTLGVSKSLISQMERGEKDVQESTWNHLKLLLLVKKTGSEEPA